MLFLSPTIAFITTNFNVNLLKGWEDAQMLLLCDSKDYHHKMQALRLYIVLVSSNKNPFYQSRFLHESPHWLSNSGQHDKAKEVLSDIGRMNGVHTPTNSIDNIIKGDKTNDHESDNEQDADVDKNSAGCRTFLEIRRYPRLLMHFLVISFGW